MKWNKNGKCNKHKQKIFRECLAGMLERLEIIIDIFIAFRMAWGMECANEIAQL